MSPPDDRLPPSQQTLVQRLRTELGEYLYLTLMYGDESTQLLYVSPTVEDNLRFTDDNMAGSHATVAEIKQCCTEQTGVQTLPFGDHRCSLHLYDEWLLLHYREPPSGVMIGVDAASASNLRGFLTDISPIVSDVLANR